MTSPAEEKISLTQLFILILLFNMGSAAVVGVGLDAGRDAWIAVLLGTLCGVILFRMYCYILSVKEGKNIYETMELLLGRKISIVLTFMYTVYFLYIAARVLRDFLELLITSTFPNTPIEVLAITFMLMVIYIISLGREVFARTGEIFFPYILIFLFLIGLFLLAGGAIQLKNLQPVLADGVAPIIQTVFPGLVGFPFGETFVLTVILASVTSFKKVPKAGMIAVAVAGVILTVFSVLVISVLGVDMTQRTTFPMLAVTREIALLDFIERLDALIVFTMMIGIYVKVTLFFFGGLKGLEHMFRISYRSFIFPVGTVTAFFSVAIANNFAEHLEEGIQLVPLYLHTPYLIILPFVFACMTLLHKRKKGVEK